MADPHPMDNLVDIAAARLRAAGPGLLRQAVKDLAGVDLDRLQNPDGEPDEPPDDEDVGGERDQDGDDVGLPMSFEIVGDPAGNLSRAAVAWRLFADDDDALVFVLDGPDGIAFAGTDEDFNAWCTEHRHDPNAATVYEADDIGDVEYDADDVTEVRDFAFRPERDAALYEGFHWGEPPRVTSLGSAPDFSSLVFMGVADEIFYTCNKGGKLEPYKHEFGVDEETGEPTGAVSVFSTPDRRALVIFGGKMRVADRGIEY